MVDACGRSPSAHLAVLVASRLRQATPQLPDDPDEPVRVSLRNRYGSLWECVCQHSQKAIAICRGGTDLRVKQEGVCIRTRWAAYERPAPRPGCSQHPGHDAGLTVPNDRHLYRCLPAPGTYRGLAGVTLGRRLDRGLDTTRRSRDRDLTVTSFCPELCLFGTLHNALGENRGDQDYSHPSVGWR